MKKLPSLMELYEALAVDLKMFPGEERLEGYFADAFGRTCSVHNPTPDMVSLEHIALTLSRIPRFGGMQRADMARPYTVAQHSVMTAHLVSPQNRLIALLHDAAEAYLGDVISPLKSALGDSYRDLERRWARAIGEHFGLKGRLCCLPNEVRQADLVMLFSEKALIMAENPRWGQLAHEHLVTIYEVWDEDRAINEFHEAYWHYAKEE